MLVELDRQANEEGDADQPGKRSVHTFQHGSSEPSGCCMYANAGARPPLDAGQPGSCVPYWHQHANAAAANQRQMLCLCSIHPTSLHACSISHPSLKLDGSLLSALGSIKSFDWLNKCLFAAASSLAAPDFGSSSTSLNLECI